MNSLKSAKNLVFFPFCILVDMPMGGLHPPLATLLQNAVANDILIFALEICKIALAKTAASGR